MMDKRREEALKHQKPVSIATANRIRELHELLKAEFGHDYSFTINGNGHVIAAANWAMGIIEPISREGRTGQFQVVPVNEENSPSVKAKHKG